MRKKQPPPPSHRRGRISPQKPGLPQEADILSFIAASPTPVGKREIARAFDLKGQEKIGLKLMLKQLEQKGQFSRKGSPKAARGNLPPVCVVEITGVTDDGDSIAIPLEWDSERLGPAPAIRILHSHGHQPAAGIGDRLVARLEPAVNAGDQPYVGRVMRPVARDATRIVGVFRKMSGAGARIVPSGRKERDDYVVQKGDENGARDGELVTAEVTRKHGRGLPHARVRARLGSAADPRNISLIAIHTHGIPDQIPDSVHDEVGRLREFDLHGREDLRHLPLITIDPADARDHDDAIWAAPDDDAANPDGYKVIVAIADVAAYVRPGSALDREARKRGNSVYFPDRVVPMLPERISNDLCSLKELEDRPALCCFMTFDSEGHKTAHRFARAVIRVAAGLAYEEAQGAIDGRANARATALLPSVLQPLWAAYQTLCKARDKRGPLELDLPERKIILDASGNVERIVVPERLDAHRLVEEFMIQANVAAAEQLIRKRTPLLFRVHEEPSTEKLRALQEFLRTVNIPLALGQVVRSKHFNRILEQAKDTPHHRVVHEVVLRSQAQARYHPVNEGHFGLSLANYAHFTSPIRRYADLIVHRALITALGLGGDGLSSDDIAKMEETADLISVAERRAMIAERETTDRLVAAHLQEKLGANFQGRISGVVSAGLFVSLNDSGADGFVPASSLGKDYYAFDATRHALVGSATGETFQLGDTVTVRLMEVTPVKGGLRFEIQGEGKAGTPVRRGQRPPLRRGKKRK